MKLKKYVSVLLAGTLALSMAACGASGTVDSAAVSDAVSSAEQAVSSVASDATAAAAVTAAISTVDDLVGKKIGVQTGTTGDLDATDQFGEDSMERFSKASDAVQALLSGKLDAVIIDDQVAQNFVEQNAAKLKVWKHRMRRKPTPSASKREAI